ncbi:MAG: hypothetical protein CFH01_00119 [Alphaproteobacteria bacterium MarineAlpha2_Bin1]|nr:MAG: hypothetical protein CFH01_00119 [Alphaproteobacteria bacterium MarineAlpha2_Bin1]|tara:strand:+ start:285 stop:725 length:441 start_codon:yes stop_codon:yes gene_type:complete
MKLIFYSFIIFFSLSGYSWSSITEYNCVSNNINKYQKDPIRFQINKIEENGSKFSLVSLKQIDKVTLRDKWSDWSFIELENKDQNKLVWFSYNDEIQKKEILKVPVHRYRFDHLNLRLITERAYQTLGTLSASLENYSCRVVGRAF